MISMPAEVAACVKIKMRSGVMSAASQDDSGMVSEVWPETANASPTAELLRGLWADEAGLVIRAAAAE